MPWFRREALRRFVCLLPLLTLIVFCSSCSDFFVSESSIQSVTISPSAVLLKSGSTPPDSYTALSSTSTTAGGTQANDTTTATWKSSNTSIVSVSSSGVLTAGSAADGNTTVTATDSGVVSNNCAVILYTGTAPATLSVVASGISFAAGTTFQVIASATFPGDTSLSVSGALTPYVTWTSSDTTIATVSSTGLVTVVSAAAPFTITATATFGAASSTATVTGQSTFNQTTLL